MYFSRNRPIIRVTQTWLKWVEHITCIPLITNKKTNIGGTEIKTQLTWWDGITMDPKASPIGGKGKVQLWDLLKVIIIPDQVSNGLGFVSLFFD